MENFAIKLASFCGLLEQQQLERLRESGLDCEANINNHKIKTKTGRKFVNVDVNSSGRYMVEITTGNIFGTKGYGVVHRGHFYGTLDTISEYNWGDYYPRKVVGEPLKIQKYSIPALTFAPQVQAEPEALQSEMLKHKVGLSEIRAVKSDPDSGLRDLNSLNLNALAHAMSALP